MEQIETQDAPLWRAVSTALSTAHNSAIQKAGKERLNLFGSHDKYVVVLSTEFNCEVALGKSRLIIGINYGLCKMLSEMTQMVFSRIKVVSESQYKNIVSNSQRKDGVESETLLSTRERANLLKLLLQSFWNKEILDTDAIPDFSMQQGAKNLCDLFIMQSIRFVLSHEFAHVLIREVPEYQKYREAGERAAEEFLKEAPSGGTQQYVRDWGLEFAADVLGLDLSVDAAEKDGSKIEFQLYSSEWFFVICGLLFCYRAFIEGSVRVTTHPPPHIRLGIIRNYIGAGNRQVDLIEGMINEINRILKEVDWAGEKETD